jgi:hypothetical protein
MSDTANTTRIFVLYNAKASLLGKLSYGYRKLCAPKDDSPCAACDLTHGGLKLQESEEWKTTKQKIPATVEQRHIDELTPEVCFIFRFDTRIPSFELHPHTYIDTAARLCENRRAEISSGIRPESRRTAAATSNSTGSC